MALDPLVAKANVGAGTDQLAGRATAGGFVGAVMLTDDAGAEINAGNPLSVLGPVTDAQLRAAPLDVELVGSINVNQVDDVSSGTLSIVGQGVTIALNARASLAVQMVASTVPAFAGTVVFEGTVNGTDWEPIRGFYAGSVGESYTQVTETLVNNIFRFTVAGFAQARVRLTTLTLGNVAVSVRASQPTSNVFINAPVPVLAQRRDSDTTAAIDGGNAALYSDESGRLKVASTPASYPDITGDITAIQATIGTPVAGGTVEGNVSRASNVVMICTGTFAGVNVSFEASLESSGATNWFSIQAVRTNANTIETASGALSAQPVYAWELSVNAYKRVRVRATARTSGTQSWRFVQGTYATEPIPAAQASATQPVSGTVTATVTAGTVNPVVPATPFILNSAANTNGALIIAGTSGLQAFYATNTGATPAFVKLYNKATAPTVGTDIPAMILAIPAAVSGVPGYKELPIGFSGFRFLLGLGIAITGAVADNDTTAIAAGQVKVMLSRTV
jgi:hypothetical protein